VTDDAGALAAAGVSVRVIPGDPLNRKLTQEADLVALRAHLAARSTEVVPSGVGARVGIGFDAHRLVAGRAMRIGGVTFPDEPRGPEGHSDGDAALHALIDALLGAARLGDVGTLFPAGAAWQDADSSDLVRQAVARLAEHGWQPVNVDIAVAIARPSIASRRSELAGAIGGLLGIGAEAVSVKGTTSDGLGFAGAEGVAAWAIASIERA